MLSEVTHLVAEVLLRLRGTERQDEGNHDRKKGGKITHSEGVIDIRDVTIVIGLSHPFTCLSLHVSIEISI